MAIKTIYQQSPVESLIGREEANALRSEIWDALGNAGGYNDIENIMLEYGLEMDYFEQLLF